MKPTLKLLALMPVLALSVACGGISPTAPDVPGATDDAAALAQSTSTKATAPRDCARIASVDLQLVPVMGESRESVTIEATYQGLGSLVGCAAPQWSARPAKAISEVRGFRALVDRSQSTSTTITATAPNGVTGRIQLKDLRPASASSRGCSVSAIQLRVLSDLGSRLAPIVEAKYSMLGSEGCAAPTWTADLRGVLVPQKDAFRIGVDVPQRPRGAAVTVWATAPNGLTAKIAVTR
jgi:hypothetical protein